MLRSIIIVLLLSVFIIHNNLWIIGSIGDRCVVAVVVDDAMRGMVEYVPTSLSRE